MTLFEQIELTGHGHLIGGKGTPARSVIPLPGGHLFHFSAAASALSGSGRAVGDCALGLHQDGLAFDRRGDTGDAGLARGRIRYRGPLAIWHPLLADSAGSQPGGDFAARNSVAALPGSRGSRYW